MFLGFSISEADASRCSARLREKFDRTAKQLAPPLKAIALRYAYPDRDLAEDLVQNALARGFRMMLAGRFDPDLGAFSWFAAVIRNEFLANRRKSLRIDQSADGRSAYENAISREPDTHDLLCADLLSSPLLAALDELPIEQRVCVELVDLAGLNYREAAHIERVPVGTIRSRLARARLKLAASLAQKELNP